MAGELQIYARGNLPNHRNLQKSTGPNSQKVLEIRSITLFFCAFCTFLWLKNPFNQRNSMNWSLSAVALAKADVFVAKPP